MLIQKISELKEKLMAEAVIVQGMLTRSIDGLLQGNKSFLRDVIEIQEPAVNDRDRMIEKFCVEMIAQFEPVARDLRLSLMAIKMNKDLERMADHAVNISQSGLYLLDHCVKDPDVGLKTMALAATDMVSLALKSFADEDGALARAVCDKDNLVDQAGDEILNRLTALMREKKASIVSSLHIMRIAHNLERVADLSTNIAEEVIYIVQGEDIKHHHLPS